jgi:hypothetical protein
MPLRRNPIPDKGAQMIRYDGWYSNTMRGVRHRALPPELVIRRPSISPPPPAKLPSEPCEDVDPMPDYENVLTD